MSRNLCRTDCYCCHGVVQLDGDIHAITKEECGVYFDEYEGMLVADAACADCEAKYLAWVDESKRRRYPRDTDGDMLFADLSFRSTFNDEPGDADMPKYRVRETIIRERIGPADPKCYWGSLEIRKEYR